MGIETRTLGELNLTCLAARTVPGSVRTLIQLRLAAWGLLRVAGDVHLVAGELITNAVRHTPEHQIRIRFAREPNAVTLAVWDSSDEMPIAKPINVLTMDDLEPDPKALEAGHDDGTGGWGLPIVQALSAECGVRLTRPHGKWVWARLLI